MVVLMLVGMVRFMILKHLIEQVLNAICENFVSWASFNVFGETEEEYYTELEKSKKTLTKWVKKVRKELKSYRDTFSELDNKSASNTI